MATTNGMDRGRIPLMLIHGAWLSARSWENFADYFDKRGFAVSAPEWPRKHGDVEELRADGDELAGLGLDEIVDHYEALNPLARPAARPRRALFRRAHRRAPARPRPRPRRRGAQPGTAEGHPRTALLLTQGGCAGARTSVEVARRRDADAGGVHVRVREHIHAGGSSRRLRPVRLPETGQVFYEASFANLHLNPPSEVNFKSGERAPLLIVGATEDHTIPASLAEKQYKKYERSSAQTDYLEFEGRPHLLMAAEGWDEVAASIDSWLDGVLDATAKT